MSKKSNSTLRKSVVALIFVFIAPGLSQAIAQESVGAALNKCAEVADDEARLSCYDSLATVPVDEQDSPATVPVDEQDSINATGTVAAATAATVVVAADSAPSPLTDDVGKERIEPKSDDEQPRFSAAVTSCQKSAQSGQYYFTFENGQVWKQSNYSSLNLRNCEFDVEISKSAFGYKMYIPSKDRTVRIARVK